MSILIIWLLFLYVKPNYLSYVRDILLGLTSIGETYLVWKIEAKAVKLLMMTFADSSIVCISRSAWSISKPSNNILQAKGCQHNIPCSRMAYENGVSWQGSLLYVYGIHFYIWRQKKKDKILSPRPPPQKKKEPIKKR